MKGVPGPETRLLVVEDNRSLRVGMARALAERFDVVDVEDRGDAALARLRDTGLEPYDVIVTDLRMPGADGQAVLRAARERDLRTAVIMVTAFATIDAAVAAMKHGAFDFVEKPFPLEELDARVARALGHSRLVSEVATLRAERATRRGGDKIVGRSAAFATALELARRVAPMRSTVLLTGETGTGKELVAGLIHEASARADGPFVKVNCAALPETLLESELFGHEKGALTSADRVRIGRFEQANGGTLFLDEIGDLSLATQAKLLRALQDQEFQRLGGTRALRTDARIVAATNRDLARGIVGGDFREDLYFRLNVISISLPPLRERREDIGLLAEHFLSKYNEQMGKEITGISHEAISLLMEHDWPGNIRELENVIERAVALEATPTILPDSLPTHFRPQGASAAPVSDALPEGGFDLEAHVKEIERGYIAEALKRSGGVQVKAAELLGMSFRSFRYYVKKYNLR